MAVANFKTKIFDDPKSLADFVLTDPACDVVISIVTDNSGKYVLFYTGT